MSRPTEELPVRSTALLPQTKYVQGQSLANVLAKRAAPSQVCITNASILSETVIQDSIDFAKVYIAFSLQIHLSDVFISLACHTC